MEHKGEHGRELEPARIKLERVCPLVVDAIPYEANPLYDCSLLLV